MSEFTQLCVWEGTIIEEGTEQNFVDLMKEKLNVRIKFAEQVITLPDVVNGAIVEGTGGRRDAFFYVHNDDLASFAIKRLGFGIRWWEDVLGNGHGPIYPKSIRDKYPDSWKA